jgi:pimeloyl-ACP methyl ester carboxylesterase
VFVHGWSCDRGYWAAQLEPFSRAHQVVAVDLAGHGSSGRKREDWTMAGFGGDVAAVVEALALDRVILVGHSMGGDVVLEAARRLSGRVVGVVWADAYRTLAAVRSPEEVEAFMAPFRADFEGTTRRYVRGMFQPDADPELMQMIVDDMAAAPAGVGTPALASAMEYSRQATAVLAELALPVVAINPESPPSDAVSMQANGVVLLTLPDVGHFLMMEDPERFNALLRDAVAMLMGAPPPQ